MVPVLWYRQIQDSLGKWDYRISVVEEADFENNLNLNRRASKVQTQSRRKRMSKKLMMVGLGLRRQSHEIRCPKASAVVRFPVVWWHR